MKVSGGVVFLVVWVTYVAAARPCPEKCKVIQNRPLPTCNKYKGTCSRGCISGYYGDKCNMRCDVNCEQETCQQEDGSCTCRTGYTYHDGSCDPHTGVKCQSNANCLDNNCLSYNRRDCLEGCKPGRFGKFCDHSCSPHCVCDEVTGNCTSCIQGWYGAECGSSCSPGCVDKRCDRVSGICTSCIQGWYGAECGSSCSPGCVDKRCDRVSGICTSCIPGWYGAECGSSCSPGCVDKNCHSNGTCVNNCISGSYGDACDQECSEHCVSGCDQLSGECVQCEAGRYGSTCQSECSSGCSGVNNVCDRHGSCNKGCRKGFYGEKCDFLCPEECFGDLCDVYGTCSACNNGFFGTSCHNLCPRCKDGVCHQKTGTCSIGCQSGFYGSFCNLTCEDCTGGDCDRATGECRQKGELSSVQFWVGGGVAVVILIIIAVYMSRRLKRIEKRRRRPASAVSDVRLVAPQGHFELEEQVTVTPRMVCPSVLSRQTSYIQPQHSGNFGHPQIQPHLQAAGVSDQQIDEPTPSDKLQQQVQRRSDEWSERPDSYVLPHYCEVNEQGIATPQGAQASTSVVKRPIFTVAADVYGTRGDCIRPIAECFGPIGTEDSSPDLLPLVENYDHLKRQSIQRTGGARISSYTRDDDEVRTSLASSGQVSTARPDNYIEPRHSGCIVPSQQQMLSSGASDQQEDKPQAVGAPPSDRLLHDAVIANVPQPAEGAEAPAHEANNSSLSVISDVQTSRGVISIPLIAECFGHTETEDSSPDEDSRQLVANYDHLFRDHYMED